MVSPRGREILDAAAVGCNDDVAAQFGEASTAEMMLGGRPLEEAMLGGPVGASAMADQRIGAPGSPLPTAPVMIISGPRDGLVEYGQAKRLARDWQAAGPPVVYRDDVMPQVGDYNHFVQVVSGGAFGVSFLVDRFRAVEGGSPEPSEQ